VQTPILASVLKEYPGYRQNRLAVLFLARIFGGLPTTLPSIVRQRSLFTVENRELCGLDRLLKQRSALRKPDFSFDFPPPRGGLRSLSVAADCLATKPQALSGLLS
jgi:hypothetical protein